MFPEISVTEESIGEDDGPSLESAGHDLCMFSGTYGRRIGVLKVPHLGVRTNK